jgi:SMODS and SLOG-associating 2TM effector domain 1
VDPDAVKALELRTSELAKRATEKNLVAADDPIPAPGDKRKPPTPLTAEWYIQNRIGDQIDFYKRGRARSRAEADRLWWVAFQAGLFAVAFGALGTFDPHFAPWIGAMATIAAVIPAYGQIDQRDNLISTHAAMQLRLEGILARDEALPMSLSDLVTTTEDMLQIGQASLGQMARSGNLMAKPPTAPAR